jgi:hypothetical protein
MLNFEKLPQDKPNQNAVAEGRYTATVFKSQMMVSKTTNAEYLNVSFKIDNGGFVNENYFDSDKPFLLYKLGRLLKACNVTLNGEGTLKDVSKVIQGKKVIIDVAVNDKGYGSLDYSGNNEGIYGINEAPEVAVEDDLGQSVTIDPEVSQAIEASVDTDEDF